MRLKFHTENLPVHEGLELGQRGTGVHAVDNHVVPGTKLPQNFDKSWAWHAGSGTLSENQMCQRHRLAAGRLFSRQSLTRNHNHHVAEAIQFAKRGIDVWRDTNALKLFVNNRRRKNSMLVEEIAADCAGIRSLDMHVGYGA